MNIFFANLFTKIHICPFQNILHLIPLKKNNKKKQCGLGVDPTPAYGPVRFSFLLCLPLCILDVDVHI